MGRSKISWIWSAGAAAVFAAVLVMSPVAGAQRRAMPMPAPVPMRAPIQAPRVVRSAPPVRQTARTQVRLASSLGRSRHAPVNCIGSGLSVQQVLNPYPSYGFNFAYQNSVNSDLALKATIDPATQLRLAEARRLGCEAFTGGGYYLLGGGYGYPAPQEADEQTDAAPPAAQPQVIVLQQPASRAEPDMRGQEPAAPVVDEGQFILVLRNGTQVQALAFMRNENGVTYITTEGTRRSIALADLDSSATIRVNEERGTPVKLLL